MKVAADHYSELPGEDSLRRGGSPSLLKKAFKGVALGFVGLGLGRLLTLAFQVLISRLHGHEFFGWFVTGLTACYVLEPIVSMGLQKGGMRFISIAKEKGDAAAVRMIARTALLAPILPGLLLAIGGWLFAPFLAGHLFGDPQLTPVLQRFACAAALLSLLRIGADMSRAFGTVKYAVAVEEITYPFLQLAFFLGLHAAGFPAIAAADAFVASAAICCALMAFCLMRQVSRFAAKSSVPGGGEGGGWEHGGVRRSLLLYSLPLLPFGVLLVLGNFIDIGMLYFFRNAADVGEYGAAARWPMFAAMMANPLMLMFGPLFAARLGVGDLDSLQMLYKTMARWTLLLMLPVFVLITAAREPLILLFGPHFSPETPVALVILALGVLLSCFSSGAGLLLIVGGHQRAELGCLAGGLLINFVFNLLLIPGFGILGAAAATALGNALTTGGRLLMIRKHLHIHPFGPGFLFPCVAAMAALAGAHFLQGLLGPGLAGTAIASCLAGGVTLAAALRTAMSDEDRALWKVVASKFKPTGAPCPPTAS